MLTGQKLLGQRCRLQWPDGSISIFSLMAVKERQKLLSKSSADVGKDGTAHKKEQILSWSAENNGNTRRPKKKRTKRETRSKWLSSAERERRKAERLKVKMMNATYAGRWRPAPGGTRDETARHLQSTRRDPSECGSGQKTPSWCHKGVRDITSPNTITNQLTTQHFCYTM